MAPAGRIHIVGVGSDGLRGLTAAARELLLQAELVLGADNALALVPELKADRHEIGPDLGEVVRLLESNLGARRVAVVATGDPLFYGVARYLCDRVGKEHFEVIPHVSTMQLAFARIKETWEEAYLTNLANHPLEDVIDRIRTAEVAGLFTTAQLSPPVVARALLERGIDYFRAFVCENLGSPDERVTQGELAEIAEMEFAPLNVLILQRQPDRPDLRRHTYRFRRFGNPDDVFAQSRPKSGLITQADVRAITLAHLDIQPASIVWDIGAGSGSVSIEAAQLAEHGMVFAIEQDAADYHLILANAEAFGVKNVKAIHGTAPAVFAGLPKPGAIFVGGTGKEISRLLKDAYEALRPGGRMVVNVATLETLSAAYETLILLAGNVTVSLIQLSRGVPQLETLRFEAANPTFLISLVKPRE
jgi:precorrin-6Y C5,15-methyltransferase (decarboxylating)